MTLQDENSKDAGTAAVVLGAALGLWLLLTAFAWPHSHEQRTNTWVMGLLTLVFSLMGVRSALAWTLNSILAIWLFVSAWGLPRATAATAWNNSLVALAIFFLSMPPPTVVRRLLSERRGIRSF
jgi:hypothetical protein